MESGQMMDIPSKVGRIKIDRERIIHFPRGLVGYPQLRQFVLIQLRENSAFLLLQSVDNHQMGLFVVEPFGFVPDYQVQVGSTEEKILKVRRIDDLTILVSVSIPPGKPEETALNLAGPVLVNKKKKIGLQVPQLLLGKPAQVYVRDLSTREGKNGETETG
ncbi:MAG: flagellar assembly protein FliW [Desulfonatronovibrionaceae bacterium]